MVSGKKGYHSLFIRPYDKLYQDLILFSLFFLFLWIEKLIFFYK